MLKIHPQHVPYVPLVSVPFTTSTEETFTIWMKSLILSGKGCTVFDSNGRIVYRVDNYNRKYCNEVYLMDSAGKVLFTIRRKKFRLIKIWEGFGTFSGKVNDEDKNPGFEVRKSCRILRCDSICEVIVGLHRDQPCQHYRIESCPGKSTFQIVDKLGRLITEVKRKQSKSGVSLGEDVLTMAVEPHIDHSLESKLYPFRLLLISASFILDRQQHQNDTVAPSPESFLLSSPPPMAGSPLNPKSNISAYYQTRAAHHAVVTTDWLAQAQAAVGRHSSEDGGGGEEGSGKAFSVIDEFNSWRKQPALAEAVAAIRALAAVIRTSEATTMMELEIELKKASDSLKVTGCDLFMLYVSRTSALEYEDFNSAKSRLIEREEKFGEISCMVFQINCGFSKGRPDRTGLRFTNELAKLDVPVKLLIDSAVAYTMDEVDMVLFRADGVAESGGIINMMGTFQIALVAHSMNKPVYVAAESYKITKKYESCTTPHDFGVPIPSKVEVETSARDYTPPQYLTLLFTDLGVLTPSVISDELIQLYL
ncbi:hypothetical protein ES319_A05G147300v1 [Gossypium barbadense]|uniref:Translation initiation factor eIF2B subunit alpha n=1 Tax=Gossypium barbadense TaxID=3634 RepID=A0A5J5VRL5_GOSBA|nr:hypothetical protein ES319_A05G147300v1 [Gossypium barbadense]